MIDKSAMFLDCWRGVLWRGSKEKLLGRELTRKTAATRSLLSCRWRCDGVLVGRRQGLVVLEHAHEWQDLLS